MAILKQTRNYLLTKPFVVKTARKIIGSKIVNDSFVYSKIARHRANRLHATCPYGNRIVSIETTLACNSNCVICTKRSYPSKVGTMSQQLYDKILKEAKELQVRNLVLSVYGEPLVDPSFVQRAKQADENGFCFTFFSNGALLSEAISKELLAMEGFKSVHFSILGFTKKTYESIMVGLDRDRTYKNISRFLQLRNNNGHPMVTINCVVFEDNIREVDRIRHFWKGKGVDNVYFPLLRDRAGTQLDIERQGKKVKFSPLINRAHKLHPCRFLWEGIFIYWNGDVGVCCEDNAARRIIIGNIQYQSLKDIWTGPAMNALRELHLKNKRSLHPVCGKQCSYNTVWL